MEPYEIIRIQDHPELAERAADWFHNKWGIARDAYAESMQQCCQKSGPVPQWYLAMRGDEILGGMGVIENDFHDRPDLAPNVCAVFTEPAHRNQGIAGRLLNFICDEFAAAGIDTLYLLTDHDSFYERYGWEFYCTALGDGEDKPSRLYRHQTQ